MGALYGGLPAANTESVRARGFLVWQSRVSTLHLAVHLIIARALVLKVGNCQTQD